MSLKLISPCYYSRIIQASKRIQKGGNILDAGCSDGYASYINRHKGQIYGVDINPGDIEISKIRNPTGNYQVAQLAKMPFSDNFFDTIYTIDVLEHIKNDFEVISEFSRTLKKGGRAIIIVPQARFPFTYDPINFILKYFNTKIKSGMWAYGHQRLYTFPYINDILRKNGFKILEQNYVSHHFLGIVDNCYLNLLVQPFVKSDKNNLAGKNIDINVLRKRMIHEPNKILVGIRDFCIWFDKILFGISKSSLEIIVVAEKM